MKSKRIWMPLVLSGAFIPVLSIVSCSSSDIDQNLIDKKGEQIAHAKYSKTDAKKTFASSIINIEQFNKIFKNSKIVNPSKQIKVVFLEINADDNFGTLEIIFAFEKDNKFYIPKTKKKINDKEVSLDNNRIFIEGFKRLSDLDPKVIDDFNRNYQLLFDDKTQRTTLQFNKETTKKIKAAKNEKEFQQLINFTEPKAKNYLMNLVVSKPVFTNAISISYISLISANFNSKTFTFEIILTDKTNSFAPTILKQGSKIKINVLQMSI